MAIAGGLIRGGPVDVLQHLDELGAQGSGHAGHKGVVEPVVPGHQALHNSQSGLQLTQRRDLGAGDGVVAGQRVSSVGEGHGLALAVLGNGIVNGSFGEAVNGVVAAKYSFK